LRERTLRCENMTLSSDQRGTTEGGTSPEKLAGVIKN